MKRKLDEKDRAEEWMIDFDENGEMFFQSTKDYNRELDEELLKLER